MNRIHCWMLSAALMSSTWLAGCKQVPRSETPSEHGQPYPVAVEAAQGSYKETIEVFQNASKPSIVNEPAAKPDANALAISGEGSSPRIPPPFSEEDTGKLKPVVETVPPSIPALPAWTNPSELPSAMPAPAPPPSLSPAESKVTRIFSHSEDYRVLVGQVQSWRHGWRLRYADFSTEDQHGGSVVLLGSNLERLQEGSLIRVQGTLIPAERAAPAQFQVQSVEVLNR